MKKNMGSIDRWIRILAAIGIAILFYTNVISGLTALVLSTIAIIFALTSFIGICPFYGLVGFKTCPRTEA